MIRKIAENFISANPVTDLEYHPFYNGGIRRGADYRYHADFDALLPGAQTARAKCLYKSDFDGKLGLYLKSDGGMTLSVNGERVFTGTFDAHFDIPVTRGDNLLEFEFSRGEQGFSAVFGTFLPKWDYIFHMPDYPEIEGVEYFDGGKLLPVFEDMDVTLSGGEYAVWYTKRGGEDFTLTQTGKLAVPETDGTLKNPSGVETFGPWLCLYPLKGEFSRDLSLMRPIEDTFWRFTKKDMYLRPYYGRGSFGRWNYPLGVTLSGLIDAAKAAGDGGIADYVRAHMDRCTETFDYAMWDKDHFGGAASLHNLLCSIDSLDDCGAFGSAMLDAKLRLGAENTEKIAAFISDYVLNKQPRTDSGALFRKNQLHSLHNGTLWADDLYMATSFLTKRYLDTKDEKYIDDAANQFIQYKKLLWMSEKRLMSHVYDFKKNAPTCVAWGRGNGWALYSLAKTLEAMPKNHKNRAELEEFFREYASGVLACRSGDGRWRQVLDESDAYLETSCSAMFICAFMIGARLGILGGEYEEAAKRAADSILKNTVDDSGNISGICKGSEFSFSSDYYKFELGTQVNDSHGVGIVITALCAVATGI